MRRRRFPVEQTIRRPGEPLADLDGKANADKDTHRSQDTSAAAAGGQDLKALTYRPRLLALCPRKTVVPAKAVNTTNGMQGEQFQ